MVPDPLNLTVTTFLMALNILYSANAFISLSLIFTPTHKIFLEYHCHLFMITSGI